MPKSAKSAASMNAQSARVVVPIKKKKNRRVRQVRPDIGLSLTRSQFTATSPLNLFETRTGSTPGGIRVKGRELIGSLSLTANSTGAFQILSVNSVAPTNYLVLNPVKFARLGAYVPIYEMFIFHKAVISFISNQPTTATGEELMCIDYDASDTAPADAVSMMRNVSSVMGNIYSDASMQALKELSRLPRYYTAETTSPNTVQINQGTCFFGIEGYTGSINAVVGYCVVDYEVEFFTPQ